MRHGTSSCHQRDGTSQLAVDDKPSRTTDRQPEPSRPSHIREWIVIVLGVACIGFGMYVLWAQHTGITADVTVFECHHVGRQNACSGRWQDGAATSQVRIVAMPLPDPGETVPMRIHGGKAYSQSAGVPLLPFGFGVLALFAGGYSRWRRRQDT